MKRFYFFSLLLISSLILFQTACKPADDTPDTSVYDKGVYITSEGQFPGAGEVAFYNRTVGGIINDIFAKGNSGAKPGSVVQSMTYLNRDTAFLVVNNSNKILMVNPRTFAVFDSIPCNYPRQVHIINATRGYVSLWNKQNTTSNTVSDSVYVLQFNTKTFLKAIPTYGFGPDKILNYGARRYVINTGGFGKDSSITSIDASNIYADSVLTTVKVGPYPNSIVNDANGDIWVLCGNYYGGGSGVLAQIRNDNVVNRFTVPNGASNLTSDVGANNLYFTVGSKIYTKDLLNFGTNAPQLFMAQSYFVSLYGLQFDPTTGYMFCTDAKNYASQGSLYIFDASTKILKDSVKVGIAPSSFSFN